jgi:anaerobic ribonucleoside-triphosphate reductase activating protein
MNIAGIVHESLIDGIGVRTVIFISGCKHNCPQCQNQKLFDFNYGKPFDKNIQDYIINYLNSDPLIAGITLSGGDPMYSANELLPFVQRIKTECKDKTIWMYTGFDFEQIKDNSMLKYIDVLVDGRFIDELKDRDLKFRGSSNQRIIDIQKTLKQSEVVLWEK